MSEKRSIDAILRLKELYAEICKYHIEKYVTFDLGMLSKYNYYTGIVFRAFISELGEPVVKGGRYDNLLKTFGRDCAATGFTLSVDDVLIALENKNTTGPEIITGRKPEHYLTFALTKGRLADKTLEALEKAGITCDEMKDKSSRRLITSR